MPECVNPLPSSGLCRCCSLCPQCFGVRQAQDWFLLIPALLAWTHTLLRKGFHSGLYLWVSQPQDSQHMRPDHSLGWRLSCACLAVSPASAHHTPWAHPVKLWPPIGSLDIAGCPLEGGWRVSHLQVRTISHFKFLPTAVLSLLALLAFFTLSLLCSQFLCHCMLSCCPQECSLCECKNFDCLTPSFHPQNLEEAQYSVNIHWMSKSWYSLNADHEPSSGPSSVHVSAHFMHLMR